MFWISQTFDLDVKLFVAMYYSSLAHCAEDTSELVKISNNKILIKQNSNLVKRFICQQVRILRLSYSFCFTSVVSLKAKSEFLILYSSVHVLY